MTFHIFVDIKAKGIATYTPQRQQGEGSYARGRAPSRVDGPRPDSPGASMSATWLRRLAPRRSSGTAPCSSLSRTRRSYLLAINDDTTRFSSEAAFPNSMQGEPASSSSPFQSPADSSLFRSAECEKAYKELLASTSAQFPARLRSQVASRSDNYTRWLALKNETTTSQEHFNALHNAAAGTEPEPVWV